MATIDNLTRALRCWWHPVARVGDVSDSPVRVDLLGEGWALLRIGGRLTAFVDRCPHRGARLSIGTPVPDGAVPALRCAYHGWSFDADGACVDVPTQDRPPTGARFCATPAAAVREAYGLVWLAPEPPKAGILPFDEADDPAFRVRLLEPRLVRTGAAQLVDNNLDWSHIPWVHRGTFGNDSLMPRPEDVTVERDGWTLSTYHVARLQGGRWSAGDVAPHTSWVGAPFTSRLRVDLPGGRVNSWYQALQPVDRDRIVVYQFIAVNDLDPTLMETEAAFNEVILDEDVGILEAIDSTELDLEPDAAAHVSADRASTAYRRMLRSLVADYQAPEAGVGEVRSAEAGEVQSTGSGAGEVRSAPAGAGAAGFRSAAAEAGLAGI